MAEITGSEPWSWAGAVAAERRRQIAKGYTLEHDVEAGPVHLVSMARKYVTRGDAIKADAVLEALALVLSRNTDNTYGTRDNTVHALQWDGTAPDANRIVDWVLQNGGSAWYYDIKDTIFSRHNEILIQSPDGVTTCKPDWFVIQDINGTFYPCGPDVFVTKHYRKKPLEGRN